MGFNEGEDLGWIERTTQPVDFDTITKGHESRDDLDAPLVPLRILHVREVDQVQPVRRTAGEG